MANILVTGALGFVGHAVCAALVGAGHAVTGLDRNAANPLKAWRRSVIGGAGGSFTLQEADLSDAPALEACFKAVEPEYVIHLAAQASVAQSNTDPKGYLAAHQSATLNVLEAMRLAGTVQHYLYASSYAVYGTTGPACLEEKDLSATPTSFYAAAKCAEEFITAAWSQKWSMPATALRIFNVYGAGARPGTMGMFFADTLMQNQPLPLFQNGEAQRDFVHVSDVAEGILRLLPLGQVRPAHALHTAFNLGSGTPTPIEIFTSYIAEYLGQPLTIASKPLPPTEPLVTYASMAAFTKATAWQPATPLADGLQDFANWYRTCYLASIKG